MSSTHVYTVRPRKDNAASTWSPMRSIRSAVVWRPGVVCNAIDTQSIAAAHMMLWFAFTMMLATWLRRTSTRAEWWTLGLRNRRHS